jgi:hypothetical protein
MNVEIVVFFKSRTNAPHEMCKLGKMSACLDVGSGIVVRRGRKNVVWN